MHDFISRTLLLCNDELISVVVADMVIGSV